MDEAALTPAEPHPKRTAGGGDAGVGQLRPKRARITATGR